MKLKLGEREKYERTESMKCIYKNDLGGHLSGLWDMLLMYMYTVIIVH